jgi:hypothetical protein
MITYDTYRYRQIRIGEKLLKVADQGGHVLLLQSGRRGGILPRAGFAKGPPIKGNDNLEVRVPGLGFRWSCKP